MWDGFNPIQSQEEARKVEYRAARSAEELDAVSRSYFYVVYYKNVGAGTISNRQFKTHRKALQFVESIEYFVTCYNNFNIVCLKESA